MWNKRKRISLVLLTEDSMEQQKMWDLLIHRGRKEHGVGEMSKRGET